MKILFFIALATIFASLPVHSTVIINNGVINCDGFICPAGSTSCTVSKKTFGDLSKYEYIRTCADDSGVRTDSKTEVLNNPRPGTIMNSVSVGGNNRNLSEAELRQVQEQIDNIQGETDKLLKRTTDHLNNWIAEFNTNLKDKLRFPFRK